MNKVISKMGIMILSVMVMLNNFSIDVLADAVTHESLSEISLIESVGSFIHELTKSRNIGVGTRMNVVNELEETISIIATGSCGENVGWSLDNKGLLTIYGEGEMTNAPWEAGTTGYRKDVKEVIVEDGVTSICADAFNACLNLTKVSLNENLQRIDAAAFQGCISITEVNLPDLLEFIGDNAFDNCSSLKKVVFNKNLKTVGKKAFYVSPADGYREYIFKSDPTRIAMCSLWKEGSFCDNKAKLYIPFECKQTPPLNFAGLYDWEYIVYKDINTLAPVTGYGGRPIIACGICGENTRWYIHDDRTFWFTGTGSIEYRSWDEIITHSKYEPYKVIMDDGISSMCPQTFEHMYYVKEFKLSDNLEIIPDRAFECCDTMQSITIPDSVKTIGYAAFRECIALRLINFGSSIERIGYDCFSDDGDCWEEHIKIYVFKCDPSIVDIDSGAFLSTHGIVYLPDKTNTTPPSDWGRSSGFTYVRYNPKKGLPVIKIPRNSRDTIKIKDMSTLVGKKEVRSIRIETTDGSAKSFAKNAVVKVDNSSIISVSKRDLVISDNPNQALIMIDFEGKREGTTNITIDCGEFSKTVQIDVGSWPSLNIYSSAKELEDSGNINDAEVLPDPFTLDVGTLTGPEIETKGFVGSLFSIPSKLEFDLPYVHWEKEFDVDKKTVRYAIGYKDAFDKDGSSAYNNIKSLCKFAKNANFPISAESLGNNYKKLLSHAERLGGEPSIVLQVLGYLEYSYATGEMSLKDGGLVFVGGVEQSIPAYPCPPVFVEFVGGFEDAVPFPISEWVKKKSIEVQNDLKFSIGGGVGIGFSGNYVKGDFLGTINAPHTLQVGRNVGFKEIEVILNGEIKLEASLLWVFKKTKTKKLGDGWTVYKYPKAPLLGTNSIGMLATAATDDDEWESVPRVNGGKVMMAARGIASAGYSRSGIFPYFAPVVANLENGNKVMFWLEDVLDKADDDRLTVYCSVYDSESDAWGEPKAMLENDAYNGTPSIATYGSKVGVLWQRAREPLGTSGDAESLESMLDLWFTEFDGTGFTEPICISDFGNGLEKLSYSVAYDADGVATVYWFENSENSLYGQEGTTTLYRRTVNGENLSDIEAVKELTGYCGEIVAGDGSVPFYKTVGDEAINIYAGNELIDSGNIGGMQYLDGGLYYVKDSELHVYENEASRRLGGDLISDFTVLKGNGKMILVNLRRNGLRSELYKAEWNEAEGTWSPQVQITDFGGSIRGFTASLDEEGEIELSCSVMEVTDDEENPFGVTRLEHVSEIGYFDLEVEEVAGYDLNHAYYNDTLPIYVTVKNNSQEEVGVFHLSLRNEAGVELKSETISQPIGPGEIADLEIDYEIPADFVGRKLTIQVSCDHEEANINNNEASFEIGLADVSVSNLKAEMKDGIAQLTGVIENNGFTPAENVTLAIQDATTEEFILDKMQLLEVLEPNTVQEFIYELPEQYWVHLNEATMYELTVIAESSSEENRLANNTDRIVFGDLGSSIVSALENTCISLNTSEVTMENGETQDLIVTFLPKKVDGMGMTFMSDNTSVATVDENGIVKAVGAGNAVVTAMADNGATAECLVHVNGLNKPSFTWSDDNTSCIAEFVGANNTSVTYECEISNQVFDSTCYDEGLIVYTATVSYEGETFTDTKEQVIPAKGHTDNDKDAVCDLCGERIGYKIVVTSALGNDHNVTVANVKGGGVYAIQPDGSCTEASIIAPAVLGYDFKGWYENIDGEPVATSGTYTFVPDHDATLTAVYGVTSTKVQVKVTGSAFRITGSNNLQHNVTKTYAPGTTVTVTYADESKEFLYWTNSNGKILSRNPEYSFTVVSATNLEAVSIHENENQGNLAFVEFISYYDQVMLAETYSADDSISFPDAPSRTGYSFISWQYTEAEIQEMIRNGSTHIVVKPVYEKNGNSVTLTVVYENSIHDAEEYTTTEGTSVRVAAALVPGYRFSCWRDSDGYVLSTSQSFGILATDGTVLTAEYVPELQASMAKRPVIALSGVYSISEGGKNKIVFIANRDVPQGYTVVEHGIIRSTDSSYGQAGATEQMTLQGANIRKHQSTDASLNSHYVLTLNVGNAVDTVVYARGYLVVEDETGTRTTLYSDRIYAVSFNDLR